MIKNIKLGKDHPGTFQAKSARALWAETPRQDSIRSRPNRQQSSGFVLDM